MQKASAASFLISENCNLNCSYCFEKTKKNINMSPEVALKALSILINNSMEDNKSEVHILLFGGEPLLNFETIKILLGEMKKHTEIKFSIQTVTNGTIINDDIIQTFKDCDVYDHISCSFQLSIDGLKEDHDFYRVYHDGKGSFDTIMKNIPRFKEMFGGEEFHKTDKRGRLHVHGSLNKKTIVHMYDSWKFFTQELKIPAVWNMPIHDEQWTQEDVDKYEEQLSLIARDILTTFIQTRDKTIINDYSPLNKCMNEIPTMRNGPFCGAGNNFITFTARGDIYPCHQFYYMDEAFKIGNIYDGIDYQKTLIYDSYSAEDSTCQKNAKCKNFNCYICPAENYQETGTIFNPQLTLRCKMTSIERRIITNMRKIIFGEENERNVCDSCN